MKKKGANVSILCLIICIGTLTSSAWCAQIVTGVVFWDKNMNGVQDNREPGIPNVYVSNGKDVVQTDKQGLYTLPAYDEM
jgi:hypothetical protein